MELEYKGGVGGEGGREILKVFDVCLDSNTFETQWKLSSWLTLKADNI